ncbi:unnamed protein product [Parnassius apollo]|uniref:(apollo) hypothetical protein n=1 Tax=Parnassius apollo TaxID=110799 RepID=A0A8S3WIZ9_PARAO|nr:unnamed protein product [Parnassius apollo]
MHHVIVCPFGLLLEILMYKCIKNKSCGCRYASGFIDTFTLNNGVKLPAVGLGTYRVRQPDVIMQAVDEALAAGYRLYAPSEHGNSAVIKQAYQKSLDNLGVDYIDLFLIHFPGAARLPSGDQRNAKLRASTWRGMLDLYDEGCVNSIGVSNFTLKHLKDLNMRATGVYPVVNQVEWHPYYYQEDLRAYCMKNEICLQAYCSFGGTSHQDTTLLKDPVVKGIAERHEATPAQVLLAWALQQDVAVIPKSVDPARIRENITIEFRLTEHDIKALNNLGNKKKNTLGIRPPCVKQP